MRFSVPLAPISRWVTAISAGGLAFADDEVVTKPFQVSDASRVILTRPAGLAGTTLRARMKYPDGTPPETPLRIRVFAKAAAVEQWAPLRNLLGDASVVIETDPSRDVYADDELTRFTTPENDAHSWDCDGNWLFLILVEKHYDGPSNEDAVLEAKIV